LPHTLDFKSHFRRLSNLHIAKNKNQFVYDIFDKLHKMAVETDFVRYHVIVVVSISWKRDSSLHLRNY